MTSVNHTPGPWFPHWNGHYFTIDAGPGENDPAVAHAFLNTFLAVDKDVAGENARLISAAPDLLEFAKAYAETYVAAGGMPFDDETLIEICRSAIAKAGAA